MGDVQIISERVNGVAIRSEALWLWAVMVFGVGSKRLWEMSDNFDSISDFTDALKGHALSSVTESEYERADKISFEQAEEILCSCTERNQKYLCYESEGYPAQLKKIANPPAVLFYKGNLDFLNDKCLLTVVGTRHPSEYSVNTAQRLCHELTDRGFVLASGFAEGIDQLVNRASLENGSAPVAVCASPIDHDYPKGSMELKNRIAEKGVVISEYFPGSKIYSGSFTARNRISVGLSKGVIFVEAGRESHGLDNFTHAVYQGKPVFVVPPHDIYDKRYFGQRDLLRNECQPVFGADDVVYALYKDNYYDLRYAASAGEFTLPAEDSGFFNYNDVEVKPKTKKTSGRVKSSASKGSREAEPELQKAVDYSQLDDIQTKICRLLEERNMLADELAAAAETDISDVFAALTELELEGTVKSLPGKMFGL